MGMISDSDVSQFDQLGYFITDVVIERDRLLAVRQEFDRLYHEGIEEAKSSGNLDNVKAAEGRRSYGEVHKKSQIVADFVKSGIYLEACQKLIGADADLYWNQAAVKPPKIGKTFNWHQDSGYTETVPLAYITCWTAVSDSNLENGCIWIRPKSHQYGVFPHHQEDENDQVYAGLTAETSQVKELESAIPVEMKAGQVAIFSSLLLHMSGPNTSSCHYRHGFVPQYHVPGVILKKNNQLIGDQIPVLRANEKVD